MAEHLGLTALRADLDTLASEIESLDLTPGYVIVRMRTWLDALAPTVLPRTVEETSERLESEAELWRGRCTERMNAKLEGAIESLDWVLDVEWPTEKGAEAKGDE